jgi:outer membrane lipoprotein-sorting protein
VNLSQLFILVWLATTGPSFAASPSTSVSTKPTDEVRVSQVLTGFQKFWDSTKTYQCNFFQSVYSKQLGTPPDENEGMLYVVKPEKLRWESTTDESFQVMNGKEITYVHRNPRRSATLVDIYPNFKKIVGARSLSFLAGKANFKALYKGELLGEDAKTVRLKLIPKDEPDETYIAEIDKGGYFLVSLTTDTVDTKVVMKFSNAKTNLTLPDKLFEYKPKPTDIVHRNK